MAFENPSREEIKEILEQTNTIAVVGLSDNPERTSYLVSQAMQAKGYRIIPVNPNADTILGEKSYPSLRDIPEKVDLVNVFRRSEHTPPIAA
ncbi:CoA-binding protein, partial [Paenibacillus sepulcri]|nr:CoA-binding protein [Paenibacillus sepulcri]